NDDGNTPPAPMVIQDGSGGVPFTDCDGVGDCSDTLLTQWQDGDNDPNNAMYMKFDVEVPQGTFGYNFSVVYHSSEWPTYVGTSFNDLFIGWQTAEVYTGNTTFIPDPMNPDQGLPMTITALDPYLSTDGYSNNEPELAGTGFEGHAGSDWIQVKAGVSPLETVTVVFYIADMSDTILATQVIIDNFHWDCEGCVPSEVDDCGVVID
ncbi:MAG: choice-of-anchor L domain-containing protein, partial [Nannocystaceae bacterium]